MCVFGPEFRPVPLTLQVLGGGKKFSNEYVFDKGLNYMVPQLIKQHSNGRPVLVFCATRKSTQDAALQLARESSNQLISGLQRQQVVPPLGGSEHCLLCFRVTVAAPIQNPRLPLPLPPAHALQERGADGATCGSCKSTRGTSQRARTRTFGRA